METLLIKGAMLIDPSQATHQNLDLLVEDGRVARIAPEIENADAKTIDAKGLVCAPGLVDMHVHLREPGFTYKEDIKSGCKAAAAGGVTSIVCMANTNPVTDDAEKIKYIKEKAKNQPSRVYPVAAITKNMDGQNLTDFIELKKAGAVAFSDDGVPIMSGGVMLDALKLSHPLGLKILCHCEDVSITRGGIINKGKISENLGVPGVCRSAEDSMTARDIALSGATNIPLHICHVSTKGSVQLIRDARRRGIQVTAETAPHYISLTEQSIVDEMGKPDADYKMSPPLRTQEDVDAVIEGLCDGTLSAIATDHAPHSPSEKEDFLRAPNGIIGLETLFSVSYTTLVRTGHMTLSQMLSLMSTQPSLILGLPAGTLAIGANADIILIDPTKKWTVDENNMQSKSKNTAFKGMTLTGKVVKTILAGKIVYAE